MTHDDWLTRIAQGTGAATAALGAMTWQEWAIVVGIFCTVLTTLSAVWRNWKQAEAAERANRD